MTDTLNFEDVAKDAVAIPRDDQMKALAKLAQDQITTEDAIKYLEDEISAAKERLKAISEGQIPELMSSLGVSEFKLENGFKVTVKPFFTGKITEENSEAAYQWMEEHGHGALVKHDLTVQVRMNQDELLEDIRELANDLGLDVKDKLGVHYMTLCSFLKEQITSGNEVPRDLLGVYQGFKTKIGR